MAGAHCERFPACIEATNDATIPRCHKPDCPGRETFKPFMHISARDQCEHQWDGPMIPIENGTSVTCSKCGTDAYSHSLRSGW